MLRHRDSGETDRVLRVLSDRYGMFDVVARGLRRAASRRAGHLEPLTRVDLLLAHGRTYDVVTQAQARAVYRSLRESLELLALAGQAVDLVCALLPERQESAGVYRRLVWLLEQLDAASGGGRVALLFFVVGVLREVGFGIEAGRCVRCGRDLAADQDLVLSAAAGGAVCRVCAHDAGAVRMLDADATAVLRAVARGDWPAARRTAAEADLRTPLAAALDHAQYHSDQVLYARGFAAAVERLGERVVS